MVKKIAAIAGGVFIGLVIAFARVGAFPFWGSDSDASKAAPAQQAQAAPEPLPAPASARSPGRAPGARGAEHA